jgi:hypothetical protein
MKNKNSETVESMEETKRKHIENLKKEGLSWEQINDGMMEAMGFQTNILRKMRIKINANNRRNRKKILGSFWLRFRFECLSSRCVNQ